MEIGGRSLHYKVETFSSSFKYYAEHP